MVGGTPPRSATCPRREKLVAFNMIACCPFLLSGLGMYKGMKFPMIGVWFFAKHSCARLLEFYLRSRLRCPP